MALPILICELSINLSKDIETFLQSQGYEPCIVSNGKDCQLKAYQQTFSCLVLNIDITNHAGLLVLKYFRLTHPAVKIILTVNHKKRLDELEISKKDLLALGATNVLIHPYTLPDLLRTVEGDKEYSSWKGIKSSGVTEAKSDDEITAGDDEFTHIKIQDFYSGNTTIFDHYVRIRKNRYVKIIHKGEALDQGRLDKYTDENKVEFLYFKTQDRRTYINFINTFLEKLAVSEQVNVNTKIRVAKNLSEKYVEEIYTTGFRPQLIEEGEKICESIHQIVKSDEDLGLLLRRYEDYDPPAYSHLFLVTFLSTVICKNLEWATSRTVHSIAFAGLLHDVGKLKLPAELRELNFADMSSNQRELYKAHPLNGVEMLEKHKTISQPIIQIIYQHHEAVDGSGFPNGLSGVKIYPLAKVLTLADHFAHLLVRKKVTPIVGLRELISGVEQVHLSKFDPVIIRALVKSFIKG